jgi:hypothetical protein
MRTAGNVLARLKEHPAAVVSRIKLEGKAILVVLGQAFLKSKDDPDSQGTGRSTARDCALHFPITPTTPSLPASQ